MPEGEPTGKAEVREARGVQPPHTGHAEHRTPQIELENER